LVAKQQRHQYSRAIGTYDQLPGLEHLYLEDSYLLAVHEDGDELRLDIEAVMTEQHPRFTPRKPHETYSYLRVAIVFIEPRSVDWLERSMKPITDPDGETDYGNIDSFTFDQDRYEITGEWGHIVLHGTAPVVIDQA
jgi:hypothetical protein